MASSIPLSLCTTYQQPNLENNFQNQSTPKPKKFDCGNSLKVHFIDNAFEISKIFEKMHRVVGDNFP